MWQLKTIKHQCIKCGKERTLPIYRLKKPTFTGLCNVCIGNRRGSSQQLEKHPMWNGGIQIEKGYINIKCPKDFPFNAMITTNGYIREHRLVMSKYLGRELQSNEIIHHLNGKRDDNRLENLVLTTWHEHEHKTIVKALKNRIVELESKLAGVCKDMSALDKYR